MRGTRAVRGELFEGKRDWEESERELEEGEKGEEVESGEVAERWKELEEREGLGLGLVEREMMWLRSVMLLGMLVREEDLCRVKKLSDLLRK